jgi:hypothetical protein
MILLVILAAASCGAVGQRIDNWIGGVNVTVMKWILAKQLENVSLISSFQEKYRIILPDDFKACVVEHNASRPRPNIFDVNSRKELVAKSLLSFNKNDSDNIWQTNSQLNEKLPNQVIAFMSDQFGNYICFDYRNTKVPSIMFWDHELSYTNPNDCLKYVADKFGDFINGMYDF